MASAVQEQGTIDSSRTQRALERGPQKTHVCGIVEYTPNTCKCVLAVNERRRLDLHFQGRHRSCCSRCLLGYCCCLRLCLFKRCHHRRRPAASAAFITLDATVDAVVAPCDSLTAASDRGRLPISAVRAATSSSMALRSDKASLSFYDVSMRCSLVSAISSKLFFTGTNGTGRGSISGTYQQQE